MTANKENKLKRLAIDTLRLQDIMNDSDLHPFDRKTAHEEWDNLIYEFLKISTPDKLLFLQSEYKKIYIGQFKEWIESP